MSRLKRKLNKNCLITLYYSFVYPHLNYCIILWGSASKTTLNNLLLLQKRAARLIDNCDYRSHTDPLFKQYLLLKLNDIYVLSCCIFAYKLKNLLLPDVCSSLMLLNTVVSRRYNTRTLCDFVTPKCRTSLRQRCIAVKGPLYWKELPAEIRNSLNLHAFKSRVRRRIIDSYKIID